MILSTISKNRQLTNNELILVSFELRFQTVKSHNSIQI